MKNRTEILNRELDKYIEAKTLLEIEINLQRKLDQDEMVPDGIIRRDFEGKLLPFNQVNRKRFVEMLEEKLKLIDFRVETVEELKK